MKIICQRCKKEFNWTNFELLKGYERVFCYRCVDILWADYMRKKYGDIKTTGVKQ